ncbi:YigZ family protein [Parabacteroides sp. 52]|uniref:IMPACT family protein n=1 Tax=unclassified Parabacteroides TaxID=2649774 RepID=UPI0013D506F7|nr:MULTISPECIES: YigZ family protein [unclassified Parabacteroides]MDH6535286.1 putative YigZ family protein [Parabacteroides sp. PM5-20]NDV55849.1 YigZ family protein [Parabacteroides sp. 52]
MIEDSYKTVKSLAEGFYSEKRSRFISYIIPVRSVEEVKAEVDKYRKRYFDARHVCWAYMLGPERAVFRANDDGEPSSTAGKPILGQINSNELTDVLILVIRYFGGIELGTSGLIVAYRAAAADAIAHAEIEERTVDEDITVSFEYPYLNGIMRIVKEDNPQIVSQSFDMNCEMTLRIRKGEAEKLKNRLLKVETAYLKDPESLQ